MIFSPGDRVRLTDQCARTFNRISRSQVNWTTRTGVVEYIGSDNITVRWDGCRSTDRWPLQALQKDCFDRKVDK